MTQSCSDLKRQYCVAKITRSTGIIKLQTLFKNKQFCTVRLALTTIKPQSSLLKYYFEQAENESVLIGIPLHLDPAVLTWHVVLCCGTCVRPDDDVTKAPSGATTNISEFYDDRCKGVFKVLIISICVFTTACKIKVIFLKLQQKCNCDFKGVSIEWREAHQPSFLSNLAERDFTRITFTFVCFKNNCCIISLMASWFPPQSNHNL